MLSWKNAKLCYEPKNGGHLIRLGPCFVLLKDACPELLALNPEFLEARLHLIEQEYNTTRDQMALGGWRREERGWTLDRSTYYTFRRAAQKMSYQNKIQSNG